LRLGRLLEQFDARLGTHGARGERSQRFLVLRA